MATIVTRSGKGTPLTNNEVDANFTNLNNDKLETSGGSVTGNVSFSDNAKAIFGAGSDLQIYHDGSNSWVSDQGTGQLILESGGAGVYIQKGATETMANFVADGAVSLYYDNSKKIETTATGIDVTGTVTTDGLTVEKSGAVGATINRTTSSGATVAVQVVGSTVGTLGSDTGGNGRFDISSVSGGASGDAVQISHTGGTPSALFASNGDLSLYEDTGTTPKFFWDASAESLGIGTTSPGAILDIRTAQNTTSQFTSPFIKLFPSATTNTTGFTGITYGTSTSDNFGWSVGGLRTEASADVGAFVFNFHNNSASGSEKVRITSAGNVGIGTTSPAIGGGRTYSVALTIDGGTSSGIEDTGALELGGSTNVNDRLVGSLAYFNGDNSGADANTRKQVAAIEAKCVTSDSNASDDSGGVLTFYTKAEAGTFAERMRLDSAGNLGIGTSSPTFLADIQKSSEGNILRLKGSTDNRYLDFTTFTVGTVNGAGFKIDATSSDGTIAFATAGNERARINSSGALLVGKTATTAAGALISGGQIQGTVTGAASATFQAWNQATSGDNLFVDFYTEGGSGTQRGSIDYNRTVGLVRYNTTSDYRAKDIIGPVQNTGATIDALKVYEGKMKGATQSRPMLIAHEAQEQAPYAVSGTKDAVNEDGTPDYQQIDHSSLVPLLIAEIQSLRARVAQLEGA